MFDGVNIQTVFTWPPAGFPLALLIFTVFSIWIYRRTLPPISSICKRLLIVLRLGAIFSILVLLFQPVFRLSFRSKKKADIAVLIDVSGSMQTMDGGKARGKILEDLLKSESFREFLKRTPIRFFQFSGSILSIPKLPVRLVFDGGSTDIANALENVGFSNPDAVLLFSDGASNAGRNPVYGEGDFPVFSIAIGDPTEKPDLLISRAQTNELVYAGNRIPIRITIRGPGFGGKTAELTLQSEGKVLDKSRVGIPLDGMETTAELYFQFDTPGFRKLTASLKAMPGEASQRNNDHQGNVQVLKSRMKILLLSSAPNPDLSFLKRILSADPNVELIVRTLKNDSEFFEGPFPDGRRLMEIDEFWLLDVPSSFYPDQFWQRISSVIQQENKPFLVIAGKNLDVERIQQLGSGLPVQFGELTPEQSVLPVLTSEGIIHPLLRLQNLINADKTEMPPVFSPWTHIHVKMPGRILALAIPEKPDTPGRESRPLIVIRSAGRQRSILILARGLFRWELMPRELGKTLDPFQTWIGQFVRWLGVREEDKSVRLSISQHVSRVGDENAFTVQVYDESAQPLEGIDVRIRFLAPEGQQELQLSDLGSGQYQAVFRPLKEGKYQAVAEASLDGVILGRDTTEFSVTPFSPEFLNIRASPDLLELLARKSGGKSGPPDSLDAVLQSIQIPDKTVIRKIEWEFSFRPVMLILILLPLSSEWFIRRRQGMV